MVVVGGPGATRTVGSELVASVNTRRGTGANASRSALRATTGRVDSLLTRVGLAVLCELSTSQPVAPITGAPSANAIAVARVSGDFTRRRYDANGPGRWQSRRRLQPPQEVRKTCRGSDGGDA